MQSKKLIFFVIYFISLKVLAESTISQKFKCAMSLFGVSKGASVVVDKLIVLPTEKSVYIYSNKTSYQCSLEKINKQDECVVAKLKVDTKMIYAIKNFSSKFNYFNDFPGQSEQYLSDKCKKEVKYLEVLCKNNLDVESKKLLVDELKIRVDSTVDESNRSISKSLLEVRSSIKEPYKKNENTKIPSSSTYADSLKICKPVVELRDTLDRALISIDQFDNPSDYSSPGAVQ